ncbi:helix-turn-helix transcriptional regulator [Antrihabitans stalactiti]|uniref:Helix-turn-helix transcriptional regulator n=1 Tax=Antrihabitans stalactiti TaxID=2584121 RepID=A0A848KFW1_9NOCA|nr:helix-turn-helix transcriptional regulator [Antrihabitans stalactiti]NMN94827.1 helix-turn-helix transcriptional regulator [Antrihabitans stalactiti]
MGTKEPIEKLFARKVKAEREQRGWSQQHLAELVFAQRGDTSTRAHRQLLAKIETGNRSVRVDEAVALAEIFQVSLDWMLGSEREEDLAFALDRLATSAQQSGLDATKIAESMALAERDLVRKIDYAEFRDQLAAGETSNIDGLPIDTLRALVMALTSENGRRLLSQSIAEFAVAATVRHADHETLTAKLTTIRKDSR